MAPEHKPEHGHDEDGRQRCQTDPSAKADYETRAKYGAGLPREHEGRRQKATNYREPEPVHVDPHDAAYCLRTKVTPCAKQDQVAMLERTTRPAGPAHVAERIALLPKAMPRDLEAIAGPSQEANPAHAISKRTTVARGSNLIPSAL